MHLLCYDIFLKNETLTPEDMPGRKTKHPLSSETDHPDPLMHIFSKNQGTAALSFLIQWSYMTYKCENGQNDH